MTTTAVEFREFGVVPGLSDALRGLVGASAGRGTWQLSDAEVAEGLGLLGQVRQLLEVAEVALVREGVERGLPGEQGRTAHNWVSLAEGESAPQPHVGHVAQVLRLAQADRTAMLRDGEPAGSVDGGSAGDVASDGEGTVGGRDLGPDADDEADVDAAVRGVIADPSAPATTGDVLTAFEAGLLPLTKADQLVRFEQQVARVADTGDLAEYVGILLGGATDAVTEAPARDGTSSGTSTGTSRVRFPGLSDKELRVAVTRTGRLLKPAQELDREDRTAKAGRALHKAMGPAGMSTYSVTLDEEGAAVIDAALTDLSEPVPGPEGEPDERSASRRRADALVEIVRRGVTRPDAQGHSEKAQVQVTIPLADLLAGVRGAGLTGTDQVLAPSVVRRLACDAGFIPIVLGGTGEILDLGRSVRWFTRAQRRAIRQRDRGCTYPGCTIPAQWCDAHHVEWWSRGGGSDIRNGALLCGRHHTTVHDRDLTATITDTTVTWHL